MAGFNEEKFRSDDADMRKELRKYNLHKDAKFMAAFDGYMDQLYNNGTWLNQGHKPNDQWSGDAANNLINEFDRINALHVPASWWRENRRKDNFATLRDAKAQETFSKKYLWSKTEPFYPAKQAAKAGGLILETSPPGRIFNGKNCGFENWSDAPVQADLWKYMSSHYVDGARGPVEAVVLEGIVANSVLTAHEWPHLKKRIEAGEVSNMHVKVMGIRGDSQDSSTWSLETKATFNIHSQNSFDQIPAPGDPQFADKQGRWRNQEKARNASKSSSSSSSSQVSASSKYSLKNFHEAFDDPNAVIVLSDPATGRASGAESPHELSQVLSRQLTRVDTNASLQGADREATKQAVLGELRAQAAASHSLDEKLTAFKAEQQRRASTTQWPGTQDYGTQLTQGMSSIGLGPSGTADYSPTSAPPGSGGSYFPQGGQYEKPYTYSLQPTTTGQGFPGQRTESPEQGSPFAYPSSPVGNAQSYNPSYDARDRTPSTESASSADGARLTRTNRHPSPPSEAPAPVQASSSGHGSSGGRKKKPEPSGMLKWLAGAPQKKHGTPGK
jgi:hypothetical protein